MSMAGPARSSSTRHRSSRLTGVLRASASFWDAQLVPRVVDKACGAKPFAEMRERVAQGLHGDVVEIGFGSGLNLPYLPDTVDRVLAVDPAMTGRHLAAGRLRVCPTPVDFVGLDGADLSLPDGCANSALSTFTLCTIPDVSRAVGELRRVLRSGGALHFLEHGLAPDRQVARWQCRLTPVQRRLAGGCHLDRPIDHLLRAGGFELTELRCHYLKGFKSPAYLYEGIARNA